MKTYQSRIEAIPSGWDHEVWRLTAARIAANADTEIAFANDDIAALNAAIERRDADALRMREALEEIAGVVAWHKDDAGHVARSFIEIAQAALSHQTKEETNGR